MTDIPNKLSWPLIQKIDVFFIQKLILKSILL